ncbi:MAG: type IV pili twitching motility protein PilT, partial [Pirellulaceae bacterium]
SMIQTGAKHGMILMDDSLFNLWKAEKVTMEDALAKSQNPNDLAKRIADARRGIVEEEPSGVA